MSRPPAPGITYNAALRVPAAPAPSTAAFSFRQAALRRTIAPEQPFSHAAGITSIDGTGAHGIQRIHIGCFHLDACSVEVEGVSSGATTTSITSLGPERRVAPDVTESALILPDTSALFLQWHASLDTAAGDAMSHNASSTARITFRCTIRADSTTTEFNATSSGLILRRGTQEMWIVTHGAGADTSLRVVDVAASALTIECEIMCAPVASIQMQLPGADAHETASLPGVNIVARARSLQATQNRRMKEGLSTTSDSAALGEALQWAAQRIALRAQPQLADVIALLATGSAHEAWMHAAAMLQAAHSGSTQADAHDALFAVARCFATTADTARLAALWPDTAALARAVAAQDAQTSPGVMSWMQAMSAIAAAATDAGDRRLAADLDAMLRRARLEHASVLRDAHWLAAFRAPAFAAALSAAIHPAEADIELNDIHADPAAVILPFYAGVLGVEPDAPRGRLVIACALPAHWTHLDVRNIRVGDALVRMQFRRTADRSEFAFVQQAGAVPLRLIFEPRFPDEFALSATVDGAPALLDPRPLFGRISLPVQVVLDEERVIAFERTSPPSHA